MLNWFRNWRTRKARKDWHLACPARVGPMAAYTCEQWASKENVARALVMPEDGYLTCEKCRQAGLLLHWRNTGHARREREKARLPYYDVDF